MKLERIYVYGAGGHGKVVAEVLQAARLPVAGFLDDSANRFGGPVLGLPVIAVGDWLQECANRDGIGIALGIGDNRSRHKVAWECWSWGFEIVTAVHPSAVISPSASILEGTVVMPGATINADARLGLGVIVNTGAVVEHDCTIGDYAHLSPNATLGGGVRMGIFSHLGLGAVVLPGVAIGARSTIGAGAVVVRDVPDDVIARGVPARVHATISDALALRT